MARIRTIKPEFFTSEQIVECSTNARLTFIGLWVHSDDGGVHPLSIKRLKMEVWPGDKCTTREVESWMSELIDHGLVLEFKSAQGESYWWVTGWNKHQKIDRANPKFPRPFDEGSTIIRGRIDDRSPPEGKGKEGKGKEGSLMEGNGTAFADVSAKRNHLSVPPTMEEVADYCRKRGNSVDPSEFIDHYTANGWMVGKTRMKDWQASVRTWEKNLFSRKDIPHENYPEC